MINPSLLPQIEVKHIGRDGAEISMGPAVLLTDLRKYLETVETTPTESLTAGEWMTLGREEKIRHAGQSVIDVALAIYRAHAHRGDDSDERRGFLERLGHATERLDGLLSGQAFGANTGFDKLHIAGNRDTRSAIAIDWERGLRLPDHAPTCPVNHWSGPGRCDCGIGDKGV